MSFKVKIEPSQLEFTVAAGQTVLDGAMAADIILPYSCRDGACSTCKGKVVSGQVEAGAAPGKILTPEELAEGYTLFCQARACSDLVIESHQVRLASDIQVRKMPARVIEFNRLADDVMQVMVQLPPSEPFRYYAGQYIEFILKDGSRRSYSMANAPRDNNLVELHIRHMPGGVFTDHVFGAGATQMKPREILRVEGPLGSFFLRDDINKPIIFLASGTGFAPIQAIIERMIENRDARPCVLYWGGRRPHDLYCNEKARQWENALPNFRYIPVVSDALPEDTWDGRTGFVHQAVVQDIPDMSDHQVYACGAPIVIESAKREFVRQCGLSEELFFADAFTSQADVV